MTFEILSSTPMVVTVRSPALEVFAIVLGVLSLMLGVAAVVTAIYLSRRTDREIKAEDARAKELLERMDQRHRESAERTEKLSSDMKKDHEETIRYISSKIERTDQLLVEMKQDHEETIKYLGNLIVAKGEDVEKLIKAKTNPDSSNVT